jgi:hypothetical protein
MCPLAQQSHRGGTLQRLQPILKLAADPKRHPAGRKDANTISALEEGGQTRCSGCQVLEVVEEE